MIMRHVLLRCPDRVPVPYWGIRAPPGGGNAAPRLSQSAPFPGLPSSSMQRRMHAACETKARHSHPAWPHQLQLLGAAQLH